jgi:hypothetical protein
MGDTVKTIGTLAVIGAAIYFTAGAALAAAPAVAGGVAVGGATSAAAMTAGSVMGTYAAGTAGAAATSGLFGAGIFTKATAGYAFKALSAVAFLESGAAARENAQFMQQQEQIRARKARLQGLQLEAQALKAGSQARGLAIVKAAAQGQDVGSGRSFLAFLQDQDETLDETTGTIQANAAAGVQGSQVRIRQFASTARSATTAGYLGAGRSLLSAAARA